MSLPHLNVRSEGGLDESPSFAPNGSTILFRKQRRTLVLSVVSTDGAMQQKLIFKVAASESRLGRHKPIELFFVLILNLEDV